MYMSSGCFSPTVSRSAYTHSGGDTVERGLEPGSVALGAVGIQEVPPLEDGVWP